MSERLNLPEVSLRLRKYGTKTEVFDVFRKKFVVLTPEEWVRQHLLHYLVEHRQFPAGLISVERMVKVFGLSQRMDAAVMHPLGQWIMLIECKKPNVALTDSVLLQIARYNQAMRIPYLLISNGLQHLCYRVDFATFKIEVLQTIPHFDELRLA